MTASVYEQLHQKIVSGDIVPGERLTEIALAERFGISRTPVREALRRLEQDGLVERAARGLVVRERSPNEILEIYEVRILLEGAAARAAAVRRTPLDIARLEQLHESMLKAEDGDAQALTLINRRFHEQIWATSHNSTLIDVLSRLNSHLLRYRGTTLTHGDRWSIVLKDHEELVDAIRTGDVERAGQLAEGHMTSARDVRLAMYAEDDTVL
ncbi:MAG TPA: GntR family transcriptional regulator [Marmoricola sp.]|nr:GntR family transcriptional regulator [Marmoricola sp.]